MRPFKTAAAAALIALTAVAGLLSGVSVPVDAAIEGVRARGSLLASDTFSSSASRSAFNTVLAPNPTDIGFAQSMIAHHNQALYLAMLVQNHPNPYIRNLSQTVRQKQGHETGLMLGWLNAWGAAPMTLDNMAWVNQTTRELSAEDVLFISRCAANPAQMPGQASASEIEKLKKAQPDEQARLFLQYMKRHHEAALEMAAFASRHASLSFVRSFSLSVIKEQGREIASMSHVLATAQNLK